MSEDTIQMLISGMRNIQSSVDSLIKEFGKMDSRICVHDEKIKNIEDHINQESILKKDKKEWSLKKWLFVISSITVIVGIFTVINIIMGWTK